MIARTYTGRVDYSGPYSPDCKIWIYQSSRAFTDEETKMLQSKCDEFVKTWKAHGSTLDAAFAIHFQRFILFFVDQTNHGATGCSIDSSVRFIQAIERQLNISLMTRTEVAYISSHGNVAILPLIHLSRALETGVIDSDTLVFDNTITKNGDLKSRWMVKISDSWHRKFI